MPDRSRKPSRDLHEPTEGSADEPTTEPDPRPEPVDRRDPLAVELGRRGGLKGGRARAAKLTPEQRSEIARKAASKRWNRT